MGKMEFYTMEEAKDELIGKVGEPERDEYEAQLAEELRAYHVGEAIKQARLAQHMTQAEVGERMGVQRSQISRIEKGKSITLTSLMRIFQALGVPVTLEMQGIGRVALC